MPFPFLPGGALLAIGVLSGAYLVFAAAIKASDRALSGLRGSMLPAVVSGLRTWRDATATPSAPSSPVLTGPIAEIVEPAAHRPRED
jgi:hypothetical protein